MFVEGVADTIVSVPDPSLGFSLWSNKYDKLLHKFRARTAMTISTGQRLLIFQGEVVRLSTDVSSFAPTPSPVTVFYLFLLKRLTDSLFNVSELLLETRSVCVDSHA